MHAEIECVAAQQHPKTPRILVFSTLFPNQNQPHAGGFIRERMFNVARVMPIVVVAPQPWFPFQRFLRRRRPHFRPGAPIKEIHDGIEVYHPRFFSVPGIFKSLDGLFIALGSLRTLRNLRRDFDFDLIDAHFGYPDGYAATLLGKWLKKPITITLRGTELRISQTAGLRPQLKYALRHADRVFCVSDSLRQLALGLVTRPPGKIMVIGNGVDMRKFFPVSKTVSRTTFDLESNAKVLITVGGLVERKGFHRIIELLPRLLERHPTLRYLIVGSQGPEGDYSRELRQQVTHLHLERVVRFLGAVPHSELRHVLSAADLFVLASSNEGWANVILESMACGLPVVATDVGGNAEVVRNTSLGVIVPFGDREALFKALDAALTKNWDRDHIIGYARANSWDDRVQTLTEQFRDLVSKPSCSRD